MAVINCRHCVTECKPEWHSVIGDRPLMTMASRKIPSVIKLTITTVG